MWYVKEKDGTLRLVHNFATAVTQAKELGTVVVDGWSGREIDTEVSSLG
jgi:hypothetical protein|tara:strand:- start:426 stop:572 length:147 start_codon:yes stop_codon:yes gene_type:complete